MKYCFIWVVKVNTVFHYLKLKKYDFKDLSLRRIYNFFFF